MQGGIFFVFFCYDIVIIITKLLICRAGEASRPFEERPRNRPDSMELFRSSFRSLQLGTITMFRGRQDARSEPRNTKSENPHQQIGSVNRPIPLAHGRKLERARCKPALSTKRHKAMISISTVTFVDKGEEFALS
jgi:hypothetical protein